MFSLLGGHGRGDRTSHEFLAPNGGVAGRLQPLGLSAVRGWAGWEGSKSEISKAAGKTKRPASDRPPARAAAPGWGIGRGAAPPGGCRAARDGHRADPGAGQAFWRPRILHSGRGSGSGDLLDRCSRSDRASARSRALPRDRRRAGQSGGRHHPGRQGIADPATGGHSSAPSPAGRDGGPAGGRGSLPGGHHGSVGAAPHLGGARRRGGAPRGAGRGHVARSAVRQRARRARLRRRGQPGSNPRRRRPLARFYQARVAPAFWSPRTITNRRPRWMASCPTRGSRWS